MKRGTPEHPKTEDLAEQLGISIPHAVGILELLFHFTARFAPRGEIGKFSDERIARRLFWEKGAEKLIEGLYRSGWIEFNSTHRWVLHDWHEHAPDYVKRQIKEKDDNSWAYEDTEEVWRPPQIVLDHTGSNSLTLPSHTIPSLTVDIVDSDESDAPDQNAPFHPLVLRLTGMILNRSPKHHAAKAARKNPGKWANEFRLMIEQDNRTVLETEDLITWIFTSQESDAEFWASGNICSAKSLRKGFDQIEGQMRRSRGPAKTSGSQRSLDAGSTLAQKYLDEAEA